MMSQRKNEKESLMYKSYRPVFQAARRGKYWEEGSGSTGQGLEKGHLGPSPVDVPGKFFQADGLPPFLYPRLPFLASVV